MANYPNDFDKVKRYGDALNNALAAVSDYAMSIAEDKGKENFNPEAYNKDIIEALNNDDYILAALELLKDIFADM